MPDIGRYVLSPEWEWLLAIEMFVAGVAAGTMFFIALARFAGLPADREVAARLGIVPAPLMLLVAALLVVDLGQPSRFLNLILRSPGAAERGPGPFMFNPNSPMTWGSYAILLFGLFTAVAFLDALGHFGWLPRGRLLEAVAHQPIFVAISAAFALATGAYSGVLINVTNQGVWSDTFMLGAIYVSFTALSGMAVAAIATDRWRAVSTAGAVRSGLLSFASVTGVLLVIFLVSLAGQRNLSPLAASMQHLVAPLFWISMLAAIVIPIVWTAGLVRRTGRLAVLGVVVLAGVLAFRYAMLYSSLAAIAG